MKSIGVIGVMAAALQLALTSPALAQGSVPPLPGNEPSEIVVMPPPASAQERVSAFVSAMTTPGRRSAMPRWGGEFCPGVVGMAGEHARAMNDRMARVALDLGIEVGAPGCNANMIVYFTRDSDTVAAGLAGPRGMVSTQSGSRESVREFVERPRAVRWWHLSSTSADGFEVERDSQSSVNTSRAQEPDATDSQASTTRNAADAALEAQAAESAANGTRVRNASRLRANTQENLARVLILVDADRVGNVRFGSLADYLAMIALAQINPNVDVSSEPSILNLFSEGSGPQPNTLTTWDLSYLQGLYRSPEDVRDSRQQEGLIVRSMMQGEQ